VGAGQKMIANGDAPRDQNKKGVAAVWSRKLKKPTEGASNESLLRKALDSPREPDLPFKEDRKGQNWETLWAKRKKKIRKKDCGVGVHGPRLTAEKADPY